MKRWIALTAALAMSAHAEFHEFTAHDGRTLKAKIRSYNGRSHTVKIEREDGLIIHVKCKAFSKEDQAYIRQWEPCSLFQSDSKLPITLHPVEIRKWKTKHEAQSSMGGMNQDSNQAFGNNGGEGPSGGGGPGGGGQSGGPGGMQSAETIATDRTTRYGYDINIGNRSRIPFDEIKLEYRIFYEQDRAVSEDGSAAPTARQQQRPGPSQMNASSTEFYHAKPESKIIKGTLNLTHLRSHERRTLPTKTVTILNRDARGQGEGEWIDLRGKLRGIWVKASIQTPDGEWITRDITTPVNLSLTAHWDAP